VARVAVTRLVASRTKEGRALIAEALREELADAVEPAKAALLRGIKKVDALLRTEEDTGKAAAGVRALVSAVDTFARLGGIAAAEVTVKGTPDGLAAFLATAFRQGDGPPPKVGE